VELSRLLSDWHQRRSDGWPRYPYRHCPSAWPRMAQSRIKTEPCRTIGAKNRVLAAHIKIDVRVILWRGHADAVEFPYPDTNLSSCMIVPEFRIFPRLMGWLCVGHIARLLFAAGGSACLSQAYAVARIRALTAPRDCASGSDSKKAEDDLPRSSYDRSTGRSDRQASLPRHGVYWLRVLRSLQRIFTIALLPAPLVAQL
jgi:hypothetical protein